MAQYHDEAEQLEALKAWWSENWKFVVAGLVLGVGAVGGWRFWEYRELARAEAASALYTELVDAVEAGKREEADAFAATLSAEYAATPYAPLGALALAKGAVEAGDFATAEAQLAWAAAHSDDPELVLTARLRLSRVQLARGAADEALKTLESLTPGKFTALVEDAKGDAYAALGRVEDARRAWQAALAATETDQGVGDRGQIQMKLDDLAPAAEAGQ